MSGSQVEIKARKTEASGAGISGQQHVGQNRMRWPSRDSTADELKS